MTRGKRVPIVASLVASATLVTGLIQFLGGASGLVRADGGDIFVTPDGAGDCSQSAPCDLQAGMGLAGDGSTVFLAEGTYPGEGAAVLTITKSITLYGGWDGSATGSPVREPEAYRTTIDAEGARRGAYLQGPITVTLDGLTIARGEVHSMTASTWDGAGLYAQDTELTLRHTAFYSNATDVYDVPGSYAYGGGAAIEGGSLMVESSVFRWNRARARSSGYGGGLSVKGARAVRVTSCTFQYNDAWHASGLYVRGDVDPTGLAVRASSFVENGRGRSPGSGIGGYAGALEVQDALARIEDNVFRGNRASNDHGAVRIWSSDVSLMRNVITGTTCGRVAGLNLDGASRFTVTNNIIAGNEATRINLQTPAVRVRDGSGQFIHNTVAHNDSVCGFLIEQGAMVTLTNTLLVSHSVGISVTGGSAARLEGTLWGGGAWANATDWGGGGEILTGTVNVWGDPHFVNPDVGDYHIGIRSKAIDRAVPETIGADVDGDSRPMGPAPDIGADEAGLWVYLPVLMQAR